MKIKKIATHIAVFVLVCIFLFYDFRIWIPHIEYQINKKYIAENLCVNRNNPQMHCAGKCYLKKQIKKTEERENQPKNLIFKTNDVYWLAFEIRKKFISEVKTLPQTPFLNLYDFLISEKPFKPPQTFL